MTGQVCGRVFFSTKADVKEFGMYNARLHLQCFQDQQRFPHVALRVLDDIGRCFRRQVEPLFLRDMVQHLQHLNETKCNSAGRKRRCRSSVSRTNLVRFRTRDPHEETPTLDGRDEFARAVGAQDQAHIAHVLLHCPTQCGLCVTRQRVGFIDDDHYEVMSVKTGYRYSENQEVNTFEPLFRVQIHLLRLSDLFEDLLDDDAIIDPYVTICLVSSVVRRAVLARRSPKFSPRRDLEMEITLDNVDVEFPL